MILHIVEPNETIYSIANKYRVSADRLILDNELPKPYRLVIGQVIVISYPIKTYKVISDEPLIKIAEKNGISLMQLLRNNPFLSERKANLGETLVVEYNNNKGRITTNGYAYTFINKEIIQKTLPFLTYLSIFSYISSEDAQIISINDTELIQIAKEYGVAPIMVLSTTTLQGTGSIEAAYKILYNENLTNQHIDNIVEMLKLKGFYGLNIVLQFMDSKNQVQYESYLTKLRKRLNQEGFVVFITIIPFVFIKSEITFERFNYSHFDKNVDGITFMKFNWGFDYGPPAPVTSIVQLKDFLDYATTSVSPEKISIGMPMVGYDWELPYIVGSSKASALTLESVLQLANEVGAVIEFDELSKTPYFEYVEKRAGVPIQHIVWFVDGRTLNEILKLVMSFGLHGIDIWNIMSFATQLWLISNSQYEIEKILPEQHLNKL